MDKSVAQRVLATNLESIENGKRLMKEVEEAMEDPSSVSHRMFDKIIRDNEDTEYGRLRSFKDIRTVDDYRKKVPLTVFDDYAEFVMRELAGDGKNLCSVYGIKQYNKSSGTMGNPKKIPMSEISMRYFSEYFLAYPKALVAKELGDAFAQGKTLNLAEASSFTFIGNNMRYAGVSAHAVLDNYKKLVDLLTSPQEAATPDPSIDSRYLHVRFGLMERDVTILMTSFMTFLLDMFHYIQGNWEMICDDIEKGTIDPSVRMPDELRAKLESGMGPMPERAAELREAFSKGFDSAVCRRIWPNIQFIIGIGTGPFAAYLSNLKANYTGDIPVYFIGVMASEGAFTVPCELNSPYQVPLINTMFMEFLPLDEEDPSKTLLADELEVGGEYELIITTMSGLYRYRTRDAYRVAGMKGKLPLLEYMFRIDLCINLCGEKTYEPALRKAMDETARELGFTYTDFCVYPNTDTAPSCYEFFVEMKSYPEDLTLKKLAAAIQEHLQNINTIMQYKFQGNLIGPTLANVLQQETYLLYRDKQIMMGGASTQVKPVKIIGNEAQLRFFRALTEDIKEE